MDKDKDELDRYVELQYALNVIQSEYPQYFPGIGHFIKPADELRNHFYAKYSNEHKRFIYVILKHQYPEIIERCRICFEQYFEPFHHP